MKKKKKWREIRSAVTMMCVMIAMLSTATYAWFSLTDSPVVTGIQMTAASTGGLKVSLDGTSWYSAIDINENDDIAELKPATLTTDVIQNVNDMPELNFMSPGYENLAVTSATSINNANLNQYVVRKDFSIKNVGAVLTGVGIITVDSNADSVKNNEAGVENGNPKIQGSFVKLKLDYDNKGTATYHTAIEAIRIALVVTTETDGTKVIVYEPNFRDGQDPVFASSSFAANNLSEELKNGCESIKDVVSLYDNGVITTGKGTTDYKSVSLFSLKTEESAEVHMYMWFEGQDPQCVDQIMLDQIEVQLQFTGV